MAFHPMPALPALLCMLVGGTTSALVVLLIGTTKTVRWWLGNALVGGLLGWLTVEAGLHFLPRQTVSRTHNLANGTVVTESMKGVDRRLLMAGMVLSPFVASVVGEFVKRSRGTA